MKKITDFIIDSSNLKAATSKRKLTIIGSPGSKFVLYLSNEDTHFYNFNTDTFAATELKLTGEIPNTGQYIKEITFPTVTDDDKYDFQLIANPFYNVELGEELSPKSRIVYKTSIEQKANCNLVFAVATTTSSKFQTMPTSVTLTNKPEFDEEQTTSISWLIRAVDAATGGGLMTTRQPLETDFEISITPESIGDGSDPSTTLYLNSVEGLVSGMSLTSIESGSVSGSPVISSINKTAKSVTLSVAQSWATAKDITFKGGGQSVFAASGINVDFTSLSISLKPTTVKINQPTWDGTQGAADDIILDSAIGIRAGANVTVSGVGINKEAGEQYVTAIDYATSSITITTGQVLKDNTILTIGNSASEALIKAKVKVKKHPKTTTTLTLNLDNILTSATT
tara:strand:+ start:6046 stop:7236 length:1191 start_codon:yes stop_codon:yes gene_type:complete